MAQVQASFATRRLLSPRPRLVAAGSLAMVALIATAVLVAVALARIATNAYGATGDFLSFYAAGHLVGTGSGNVLYEPVVQEWTQRALYPGGFDYAIGFPLPVFAAWLFAPFAKLPFTTAFLFWIAIQTALLLALCRLLAAHLEHVPPVPRRVFVAVFALSMPSVSAVIFGQVDLFVFAGLFLAYTLLRSDRRALAGAALSMALFKPHFLAGIVVLLIVWQQWRVLLSLTAIAVPLLTLPALLTSPGTLLGNLSFIGRYPGSDEQLAVNASMMSNWRGFIVSVTNSNELLFWLPGLLVIAAAALWIAARTWRRSTSGDAPADQAYALAVLLPLLASPHLHTQSLVLLFIPLAIVMRTYFRPEGTAWHDDDRVMDAVAALLLCFALLFALWFIGAQGLATMVFLILAAFALCAFRWPDEERGAAFTRRLPLA